MALARRASDTRSLELRCGGCTPNKDAESGLLRPIMSALSTATICARGTIGYIECQREPNKPRSSAPCHTHNADRGLGCCFQARAMASSATATVALSSAPFQMESPSTGKRTPSWSWCALKSTYSLLRRGSLPESLATMFTDG